MLMKTIQRVFRCTAFLLILIVLLIIASCLFAPQEEALALEAETVNGIRSENDNTIDVLVLGDSEAYAAISPMLMWQEYGFTSYICATSAQYLSLSDALLKQAFQKQSPKVVILEANAVYRKMILNSKTATRAENLLSIFKYHDRWKSVFENSVFEKEDPVWSDDLKGFDYNASVMKTNKVDYMAHTDEIKQIQPINEEYVRAIAEFCKENGAEFLLVNVPSAKNWSSEKHNGIQALADKYAITYIDLNLLKDEVPIDWKNDTRDKGDHVNYYGAVKTTAYLGKYLKEHYLLPDHRTDSAYAGWNDALVRYLKVVEDAA